MNDSLFIFVMKLKISIPTATILVLSCFAPRSQPAHAQVSELKEVKHAGVTLVYSIGDFAEVVIEKEKKVTAQDLGGVPIGVWPEHVCFNLKDKRPLPALEQGARYFNPTFSFICVLPLKDSSVRDFSAAYPDLNSAALTLQKILRERPGKFNDRKAIPDIPYNNSSPSILSRFQYLDFRSGSGILFLTQYSQEMDPNPVNSEELTLNFQGMTRDGRFYVAARLAITHPSLPKGIDFTDEIERDRQRQYLRKAEKELEGFSEESFRPSFKSLKALLSSIDVE